MSQLPKPGTMMSENSTVILYTDTDNEELTVTVPNLESMSVSEAKDVLAGRDLNFEIMGAGHSESAASYAVNQSIKAGEKVMPGTVIGVEFRQVASD